MPNMEGDALVTPNQSWIEDGTAIVAPYQPFPEPMPRVMPLDNRPAGDDTITRDAYPLGLVIIPTGHEPSAAPAVLPVTASAGDEVHVTSDTYVDCPDGFVIWFLSR